MLTTENTKGDLCRGRLNETLNSLATKYQTPAPKSSQDRSDDALPTGSDYERYLLGCALENHELINQITWSISDDFLLPDHRAIWEALLELNEEGLGVDPLSVADKSRVAFNYVTGLMYQGALPERFVFYACRVQELSRERKVRILSEQLSSTSTLDDSWQIIEKLHELRLGPKSDQRWEPEFHSYSEIAATPETEWLIENFAEVEDLVMIGGPSGHGKSLMLLSMCRALLTQEPLFGFSRFRVPKPASRLLYLIPEVGLRSFKRRLEWFGLLSFAESKRLFIRTQSRGPISLSDPRVLAAAEGADVFLDTAIRFSEGDENGAADNRDGLAAMLFELGRAGARSVICAHHAVKGAEKQTELTLDNCLRGSGDIGAMLSTAYGVRQVDRSTNRILVQCIKPRDIDPLGPFEIQGRPFIRDVGDFRVVTEPSNRSCTELLSESKERNAEAEAIELFGQGLSGNKVEEELKKKGLGIRRTTVQEWKRRYGEGSGSQGRFPPKKEPAEPAQVNTL